MKSKRQKNEFFNYNFFPKNRKGVSPIIATILLIALVVLIGAIVFTWFKGLTQEAITKFDGQNIKLVCEDVNFEASYSGGDLTIQNLGNIPIYDMDLKMEYPGGHEIQSISDTGFTWPETGLNQGGLVSESLSVISGTNQITLIPILLGVDKEGNRKSEACDERHGLKIFIYR